MACRELSFESCEAKMSSLPGLKKCLEDDCYRDVFPTGKLLRSGKVPDVPSRPRNSFKV